MDGYSREPIMRSTIRLHVFLFLVLLPDCCNGRRIITNVSIAQDIVVIGETGTLRCEYFPLDTKIYLVQWYKDNKTTLVYSYTTAKDGPRNEFMTRNVTGHLAEGYHEIKIPNVQKGDRTTFWCSVSPYGGTNKESGPFFFNITEPMAGPSTTGNIHGISIGLIVLTTVVAVFTLT